jgi:hypothetical protein
MRSYIVFQFTQRAIENRSTCHRLPTPALDLHPRHIRFKIRQCYWLS